MMQRFSTTSFILGVMFGALVSAAWFLNGPTGLTPFSSSPFLATTVDSLLPQSSAIIVADQSAGPSVTIESVTIPSLPIWVAVLETNGHELGNVLGAARILGSHSSITVTLLRATEPNRTYAVELYRDDNYGVFDPSENSVYVDFDTGMRAVSYFTTTP